jgi:hypothetical protein
MAVLAIVILVRKQYDSNIPLLFYFIATLFTNGVDRPIDPLIMYGSMAFVLLLRFEFMNVAFSKFVAFCATVGLCAMVWMMLSDVLA